MSVFQVKPKSGGNYEQPPAGSHAAVCVAVIDLGTQTEKYGDKPPTESRKVFLVWELCDEKTSEGKPHYLGNRFTLSIHEKSNLGQLLRSWGAKLAKDDEYDVRKLAGKSCLLNITHETSTKGNEYAAVAGLAPLPKGMKASNPTVKPFAWEFEPGAKYPTYDWLPYVHGTALKTVLDQAAEAKGGQPAGAAAGDAAESDDQIPF